MKKFNFSLQKVLEIKEQVLESLKLELINLNHDYRNTEQKMVDLKARFQSVDRDFVEKSAISVFPAEMVYYKMYMSSILKQIENKKEEKENLLKKIESKRYEIINMNKEISSIEKLKENELEKYKSVFLKSEEIFIDEFVSNKSIRSKYAI